jgi:hypothetical protein
LGCDAIFKTGVADVRVDVLALQGQDLINSLTKGDFTVTDEGQPQSLIAFAHGDEALNLILLFDISGSMQKHIEQIAKTARQALAHLRPGDRVAIMVFAKTSAVHQDFSDNLAETARQISSAVHDHEWGCGWCGRCPGADDGTTHRTWHGCNDRGKASIPS